MDTGGHPARRTYRQDDWLTKFLSLFGLTEMRYWLSYAQMQQLYQHQVPLAWYTSHSFVFYAKHIGLWKCVDGLFWRDALDMKLSLIHRYVKNMSF
jgi:hypothetical protein